MEQGFKNVFDWGFIGAFAVGLFYAGFRWLPLIGKGKEV